MTPYERSKALVARAKEAAAAILSTESVEKDACGRPLSRYAAGVCSMSSGVVSA